MPYTGALLIGVSGGHTRSVACAIDRSGRVHGVVEGESLNMHTYSHQEVKFRFERVLDQLANKMCVRLDELRRRTARIVLSMAGAGTGADQALIEACLLRPTWTGPERYMILDDTWAGLLAGTFSCSGTCAFAGTGASVYVSDKPGTNIDFHKEPHETDNWGLIIGDLGSGFQSSTDRKIDFHGGPHKIDGWGPTIGDYGSGFQLSTDMFRLFNRELDKGNIPELFRRVLQQEPDIGAIGNVQLWFDSLYIRWTDWRIRFAKLASVATSAADAEDDRHAVMLVEKAAKDMVESIEIALGKFPEAKTMPVVFQGGMFEFSRLYTRIVSLATEKITSGPVYLAMLRPIVGALIIAMADSNQVPHELAINSLFDDIKALPDHERLLLIRSGGYAPFKREVRNGQ